ncbi:MAG: DUF4410 domain-containing protein [Pseudomonadota bacterium]
MKTLPLFLSMLLLLGLTGGCSKEKTHLNPSEVKDLAVLTLGGNFPEQTADQERELLIALEWLDRDFTKRCEKTGIRVTSIKDMQDYKPSMGKLLVVDVERFSAGNRAARAFVGFGAGSASLALNYKLLDENGTLLSEWKDGVSSSKGSTNCAEILNRKALENVIGIFRN